MASGVDPLSNEAAPGARTGGDRPLAGTVARCGQLDGADPPRVVVGDPVGDRWFDLDQLDAGLEALAADLAPHAAGRRDYLAASVASAVAGSVVTAAWVPLLVERRLPELSADNLVVHRHSDEGWLDRVAIRRPACLALAGDPAAHHPDLTVVAGLGELHRRFADGMVAVVGPWFDAVRARLPFGRAGMWGQLADGLCGTSLWTARRAGLDQAAAWDEAHAVVDLVAARVPVLRARPRWFPVRWRGGETAFQVKGTCCLWYRTQAEPDPCGEGYCTTCPFRPDGVRRARLAAWLEEEAAAG